MAAEAAIRADCFLAVAVVLILSCSVGFSDACIDGCVCLPQKIRCSSLKLSLPVAVEEQSTEIEFRQMLFPSRSLQRRNLTTLLHVTSLTISASGFEYIEPGAFAGMTRLRKLDLSDNNIGRLEPRTFDGLSMDHLFLNRNPRLDLSATDALAGLRTTGLYLSQCGLAELSAEQLRPVERSGLRVLWLEGNGLQRLDPGLEPLLRQLQSIKIGDNPLDCGCRMLWFKRLLDQFPPSQPSSMFVNTPQQLRCSSPAYLAGSFLSQISHEDMQCRQQSLDLSFAPAAGELRCESRAMPQASLVIAGPVGTQSVHQAARGAGEVNVARLSIVGVGASAPGLYSCVSVNAAGNLSVTINVTLPPTIAVLSPSAADAAASAQAAAAAEAAVAAQSQGRAAASAGNAGVQGTACPEQSYASAGVAADYRGVTEKPSVKAETESKQQADILTAKYFSLVDILCAALGTFLATLTVCVLVLHFCVYRRRPDAASSSMGSPPPSDYSTGSVKGYAPPLPASAVALPMRQMTQTHFVHHKPMYDPDNHYMTTNLEEVEFLHQPCQACTMSRIS